MERNCCKKSNGHSNYFLGPTRNQRVANRVGYMLIPKNNYFGRDFFKRLLFLLTDPKFQSLLILSSNNSGHELSHGDTLYMCCNIKISSNLPESKNNTFLHFCATLQKVQVAANWTMVTPVGFPIAHLKKGAF